MIGGCELSIENRILLHDLQRQRAIIDEARSGSREERLMYRARALYERQEASRLRWILYLRSIDS